MRKNNISLHTMIKECDSSVGKPLMCQIKLFILSDLLYFNIPYLSMLK